MNVLCRKCNTSIVQKLNKLGPRPTCDLCLEKSLKGRLERQRQKRAQGYNHHNSPVGMRYPDKFIRSETQCYYCHQTFTLTSKPNGKPVCPGCTGKQKEERRIANLTRVKAAYRKDPQAVKLRRLAIYFERLGMGADWYVNQPKVCGICQITNPGPKGWCVDHDHTCCPYGLRQGCKKCIRGLLCNNCNRGLGYFQDDPKRLLAAIAWVSR
jgi:Recombination endonuclease VII